MSNIVIFEDQTLTFTPSDGLYLWQSPVETPFTEGTKFIVIWDGVSYACRSSAMSLNGLTGVGIGNKAIIGIGEDTGEPFVFGYIPAASSVGCYTASTEDSHIVSLYEIEEDVGIILKDRDGNDQVYEGVEAVKFNTSDGGTVTFIKGETTVMDVVPDFAEGDMVVTPEEGKLLTEVTIQKPENLLAENILKDVEIAGVVGSYEAEDETGGSGAVPSKAINFYDVFGNIVYSYTREEAKELASLPPIPEIEGFESYAWYTTGGSSYASLDNVKACDSFMDIVPRYKKDDLYVDLIVVEVTEVKTISLSFYYTSYMKFDWGDGSGWVTGASSSQGTMSHTYTEAGKYVIAFYSSSPSNCYIGLKSNSASKNFVGGSATTALSYMTNGTIIGLFIFSSIKLANYAIYNLPRLKIAAFNAISNYNFYNCFSLEVLVPIASSSNANPSIYNCYSLKRLSVRSNTGSQFVNLTSLKDFKQTATGTMYSVPDSYGMRYIFTATTPPTLSKAPPTDYNGYTIYVPDEYVDTYKTSWSSYATYIKPLSEYPDY